MNFRSLTFSELLRYCENYELDNQLINELNSTIDDLKFESDREERQNYRLQAELDRLRKTGTIPIYEAEIAELEWQNNYLIKQLAAEKKKRKLTEEKLDILNILKY